MSPYDVTQLSPWQCFMLREEPMTERDILAPENLSPIHPPTLSTVPGPYGGPVSLGLILIRLLFPAGSPACPAPTSIPGKSPSECSGAIHARLSHLV